MRDSSNLSLLVFSSPAPSQTQVSSLPPQQTGYAPLCLVPVSSQDKFVPVPLTLVPAAFTPSLQSSTELQYARCMSARHKADPFARCVSCTRRWAGDTCRFQNIRILVRDVNKNLLGTTFQPLDAKVDNVPMQYPERWNILLERRHVDRVMVRLTNSLRLVGLC